MKPTRPCGLARKAKFEVTRGRTIDCMGGKARVHATPMRVPDVEAGLA